MPVNLVSTNRGGCAGFALIMTSVRQNHKMLFKGPNGRMCSTISGPQYLALFVKSATDEFIENCKECAEITGNLNLFEEMFGDV